MTSPLRFSGRSVTIMKVFLVSMCRIDLIDDLPKFGDDVDICTYIYEITEESSGSGQKQPPSPYWVEVSTVLRSREVLSRSVSRCLGNQCCCPEPAIISAAGSPVGGRCPVAAPIESIHHAGCFALTGAPPTDYRRLAACALHSGWPVGAARDVSRRIDPGSQQPCGPPCDCVTELGPPPGACALCSDEMCEAILLISYMTF